MDSDCDIPTRADGSLKRFWYAHGHVHYLEDDHTIVSWSIHCHHEEN